MSKIILGADPETVRDILEGAGCYVTPLGQVYPSGLSELPDDYPWSITDRKGPLLESDKDIVNHPLPCAILPGGPEVEVFDYTPLIEPYAADMFDAIISGLETRGFSRSKQEEDKKGNYVCSMSPPEKA
jgi:hypothetical protein